jgi:hypothetical protein
MNNLYLGIDESNTGRYPEFYVAIASSDPDDVLEFSEGYLRSKMRAHRGLEGRRGYRDYRFLLNPQPLHSDRGIANIVASLIKGFDLTGFDSVCPFIDGDLSIDKKLYIPQAFAVATGLDTSQIIVKNGPQYDRRIELVNIADEMAHFIF